MREAEQRSGQPIIRIYTPEFNIGPNAATESHAQAAFDRCAQFAATYCMPHQCVTDPLLDRRAKVIRDLDRYTHVIREWKMIPGLSTHVPEAIVYADATGADVETYIQPYNSAGFLMQLEAD